MHGIIGVMRDELITDAEIAEWLMRNAAVSLHGQSPLMDRLYREVQRLRADREHHRETADKDVDELLAELAAEKAEVQRLRIEAAARQRRQGEENANLDAVTTEIHRLHTELVAATAEGQRLRAIGRSAICEMRWCRQ